ncbi:hypothetical protein CLU79DRAFT_801663 [Phycomyces nitens]|nr:hypothetical protein CLU79DRAFT_801663 [Phycomyces nitens]
MEVHNSKHQCPVVLYTKYFAAGLRQATRTFFKVFNFKKLGLKTTSLLPNGNNDMLFGNLLRSDGFSLDFLFYKRRQIGYGPSYQSLELKLGDFTMSEIDEMYTPIFIDPGRKSVFTATIGSDLKTRRCTRSEYHHITGVTNFSLRLEKKKNESGIGLIESNLPTAKTSNIAKFEEYIKSILTHLDVLFRFYDQRTAKDRFNLYQGSQRAPEQLVNILTHGTAKYNRSRRDKKTRRQRRRKKKEKKGLPATTDKK